MAIPKAVAVSTLAWPDLLCEDHHMNSRSPGLIVWDVDGTMIPADLRWLRRAIARTFDLAEADIVFPSKKVHGYTDESIVVDTALASGIDPVAAERGVQRFHSELAQVMTEGRDELAREQPAYPGVVETLQALQVNGFRQTVLTGNIRVAAEIKLQAAHLDSYIDWSIGAFGSDARDRFELPAVVLQRHEARYGYTPGIDRVVVIGDAPNDIACARQAGFHVVAVAHRVDAEELASHKPDAVFNELTPTAVVAAVKTLTSHNGH